MSQTHQGAMVALAKRHHVPLDRLLQIFAEGKAWCNACKDWHERSCFSRDASRWDGLARSCRESAHNRQQARYQPKPGPKPGRVFVAFRDGDKRQAKRRVNHLVGMGLIPKANSLPCTDCGHIWCPGERRHEYDHYLGYSAEHHEDVQACCTKCHRRRAIVRKEWERVGITSRRVLGLLQYGPTTFSDLVSQAQFSKRAVEGALRRLRVNGKVEHVRFGLWALLES